VPSQQHHDKPQGNEADGKKQQKDKDSLLIGETTISAANVKGIHGDGASAAIIQENAGAGS
jgi:hypothetical protein